MFARDNLFRKRVVMLGYMDLPSTAYYTEEQVQWLEAQPYISKVEENVYRMDIDKAIQTLSKTYKPEN